MPGKKKRSKKKKSIKQKKELKNRLYDFLKDYGSSARIQKATEEDTDRQLLCITSHIAEIITRNETGTLIDIGCGNGILLAKLANVGSFKQKRGWSYVATDFEELKEGIFRLSLDRGVHKKVDFIPLEAFYRKWPDRDIQSGPHVVVIRNVFHELGIKETTQLLAHVRKSIDSEDSVIVQDLTVFAKAERGNVCWTPTLFNELLTQCGLDTSFTEDRSPSGNRWFTIFARRGASTVTSVQEVEQKVTEFRTHQLSEWRAVGALRPDDEKFRDFRFAKLTLTSSLLPSPLNYKMLSKQYRL